MGDVSRKEVVSHRSRKASAWGHPRWTICQMWPAPWQYARSCSKHSTYIMLFNLLTTTAHKGSLFIISVLQIRKLKLREEESRSHCSEIVEPGCQPPFCPPLTKEPNRYILGWMWVSDPFPVLILWSSSEVWPPGWPLSEDPRWSRHQF